MKRLSFLPLSLALVVAGCASDVKTTKPVPAAPPQHATQPQSASPAPPALSINRPIADRRVFIDPALHGAVQLLQVSLGSGDRGFLRIELGVKNAAQTVTPFGYQFEWIDRNGEMLDVPSPDIPVTLKPDETTTILAMAPTPLARSFRVYFFVVK
jgi:uncharacterized protein YcfL